MRSRESRIPRDRLREERGRSRAVLAIETVQVLQPQVIGRPCVELLGDLEARECRLVQRNAKLECREYTRADPGTYRVDVVERAGVPVRPDDATVARVHQFDVDLEPRSGDLHVALQAVAHAQESTDLAHVGGRRVHAER